MMLATYTREEGLRMQAALARLMQKEARSVIANKDHMPREGRPIATIKTSEAQAQIHSLLLARGPMIVSQIAEALGRTGPSVSSRLQDMRRQGSVKMIERGVWAVSEI
ncbi:helix-turn-helix domain-containing protein [Pseudooceanicola sp. C21-150M6]|uniref:helix-turn-helix domain-containing protein n=1 Tax=Pseudooceanicola sp. C21-150M6 TaxID=3434355 RepID=UPI003D7FD952